MQSQTDCRFDPPPVRDFSPLTRKKASGVTAAVEAYLSKTPLTGAQEPLAALARLLAESLEAAPLYARASLARQLRDLLTDLEEKSAWEFERAERRAKRLSESQWARNGET